MLLECIIFTVIGFFSGSLMFSYFIPKAIKKVDVRSVPGCDGNPGSSNAIRAAGVKIGIVCMALDVLKGFLPVFAAIMFAGLTNFYLIPVMIAPVLGHAFSPFLNFKGGKAISASYGVLLAILPFSKIVIMLALTMAFFKFIVVIKPDSSEVIVSSGVAIVLAVIFEPLMYIKLAFIAICAVIIYKVAKNPDGGEQSIHLFHLSCSIEDSKLKFRKI
jgi:glycerol-3-phosphate acyltransferase PlsY